MTRISCKAAIAGIGALALAAGAWSATAALPSAIAMNLQPADVPGAKVVSQHEIKEQGFLAAYDRNFSWQAGAAPLLTLESETLVASTAAAAAKSITAVEKGFRAPASRKAFVHEVAKGAKVNVSAVRLGALRKVAGYDQGFDLPISVKVKGGKAYENLVYLRLDRVAVFLFEVAIRPVGPAVTGTYAAAIAAHIATELAPHLAVPPAISGTPQQGQTLTATPGTWAPSAATFAYQWQRCDQAGANCADVTGATTSTYAVTSADVGAKLKVVVTATNRFGSVQASAAESAATI